MRKVLVCLLVALSAFMFTGCLETTGQYDRRMQSYDNYVNKMTTAYKQKEDNDAAKPLFVLKASLFL